MVYLMELSSLQGAGTGLASSQIMSVFRISIMIVLKRKNMREGKKRRKTYLKSISASYTLVLWRSRGYYKTHTALQAEKYGSENRKKVISFEFRHVRASALPCTLIEVDLVYTAEDHGNYVLEEKNYNNEYLMIKRCSDYY